MGETGAPLSSLFAPSAPARRLSLDKLPASALPRLLLATATVYKAVPQSLEQGAFEVL